MATILTTQNGKYKAVLRDAKGRYIRSKTFTRKTDARAWARRMEADQEAMVALGEVGARLPFSTLVRHYLDAYKGKDTSRLGQIRWWAAKFADRALATITADDIRGALDDYTQGDALRWDGVASGGKPKFTSRGTRRKPATVNRMRAALASLFRYAIDQGWLSRNPVHSVRSRPEHNKRVRYLSAEERTALLAACRASPWRRLYLLVLMALMTGARQGELLALSWEKIDFAARTAYLAHTKNGERRVITLPQPVIEELMRFRAPAGLLFPGEKYPQKPYHFRKHWDRALSQAGIQNFRFHDLRHSAASYLAMNGASLIEIADVLGHKSLQTTQRYAHLSIEHKQQLTDRVFNTLEL
ncbi:tyrosine-type recombinase/integrase [Haliea sp. E17]|uniref:tyrosine-type recombinase/integrase n=1 Tax=Haliea sp. E17 TaxID=3401576 RepID=UPI003AAA83A6